MTEPYNENYIGEQALKKNYISSEQLEECKQARQKSSPPKSLARMLFEKGYLSDEQLGEILKEYRLTVGEMMPDDSDPGSIEFGEAVVKKGLAKNVDIWEAIEEKAQKRSGGGDERLGQILIERGTLALTQAKDILESQGKMILKCTECGHQYDVKEYNLNKEYTCLNCGGPLSQPETISSLNVQGTAMDSQTVKASIDDKFVGKEIGGCEILEKLGEGGMGSVYKARHRALNKVVAVKIMSSALMGEIHRKRFLREARAAAQLEHQNIIQVHDTGVAEGYNYIVMQFIDGESIQRRINRDGSFDQKQALGIIRDSADALGFAHRRHMIHRDIKPDNIMLTSESITKVADFGLVKSTEIEKDLTGMSQSMLMGTPHYMSPEQFEGKIIDHRTDIYSLGVTLYYMLTGQKPYDGTTPYQIMQGHLQQEFVDPTNLSDEIYPEVSKLVRKMMARDREQRYQSCEDIVSDVDKMLRGFEDGSIATGEFIIIEDDLGETMQAQVPQVGGKPSAAGAEPAKKSAMAIVIPAVVLVLVVVGLLVYFFAFNKPEEKKNGDTPVVVNPDEKPDQKEAQRAFAKTKVEADNLAKADNFAEAMSKWDGFVPKWGEDPWKEKVDIERALILELALERIGQLLASGTREDIQKALSEAQELGKTSEEERLAALASEAEGKLRGMEDVAETLNRWREDFAKDDKKAQELVKQDKLDDAKKVYAPKYTTCEFGEIKSEADKKVAAIDKLLGARKQQWADYNDAETKAKSEIEKSEYESAINTYKKFTVEPYIPAIQEAAGEQIALINQQWNEYQGEQFKETMVAASGLFDDKKYEEAHDAIKDYLNHTNTDWAAQAKELDARIQTHQDFWSQMDRVESLREKGQYSEALNVAGNFLNDKNGEFQNEAVTRVRKIKKERYLGKNLLFMDGGDVSIGSDNPNDRNPRKTVNIKRFYVDKTEVTNGQYAEFVRDTGRKAPLHWSGGRVPRGLEDHPVAWVSYEDANAFCEWRSKKEGATYRLPTESEWEYSASYDDGNTRKNVYPWGNSFDGTYANLDGNTKPVGSIEKDKSPLGVYDMAGNVAEWTVSDDGRNYVVRGGSILDKGNAETARVSFRHQTDPGTKGGSIGFRCIRVDD